MPAYVVVDASVAGAWMFPEPFSSNADPVWRAILGRRVVALVPDRFAEEVMRICQKKTLLPPAGSAVPPGDAWDRFVDVMSSPVFVLPSDELHVRAWQLAFAAGLTTHDALYLTLAEQWGAELWTLDAVVAGPAAASFANVRDPRSTPFPY